MTRFKEGTCVRFAYPIEGVNQAVVERVDGEDVYLTATVKQRKVGLHRYRGEVMPL